MVTSAVAIAPALSIVTGNACLLPSRTAKTVSSLHKIPGLNIRCARVGGVEVPNNKRIEISLQYVHGIGKTTARKILFNIGLQNKLTRELTEEELTKIREEINTKSREYKIEGELRRDVNADIRRLKEIQCYRGKRHIMGLPCRGQHTKCNARTRKGKRVTVAGKKKTSARG